MSPLVHAAPSSNGIIAALVRQLFVPHSVGSWAHHGSSGKVAGAKIIRAKHLPHFSRKLSAMLGAGMPIVRCLTALENQTEHGGLKYVIHHVRREIENGKPLSEALSVFPTVFDDLYVSMVRCGEKDGRLPETVGRLAGFLESSLHLRGKIKSAMAYPIIVVFIATGITAAMLVFVVPVLSNVFDSLNAELPAATRWLVAVSGILRESGIYVVALIGLFLFLFKRWRGTARGRYATDWMFTRLPIFGPLNKKIASARFARAFGDLIRGGVPVLAALEVGAGATGNKVAERIVLSCSSALVEGKNFSSALTGQSVFPDTFVEMLQAGEETGKVDEMMDCIGDFYEQEVDAAISGLTALLEPLLMVFLGVFIGGMVVCLFMPIFMLPGAIG